MALGLFFLLVLWMFFSLFFWTLKLGISPMPSSKKACQALLSVIPKGYEGKIIDLGCGFGWLCLLLSYRFPEGEVIGYEISPIPFFFAKLMKWVSRKKNLHIIRKDFTQLDQLENCIVYAYQFPKGMKGIEQMSFSKVLLISNTFQAQFPLQKEVPIGDLYASKLYLYHS